MRDLTKTGYNSNSPLRNYIKLSERIEELNKRLREMEQITIDLAVRLNEKR